MSGNRSLPAPAGATFVRHAQMAREDARAPPHHGGVMALHITGVVRFERFFRAVGGIDVDKEDLGRYSDFVARKTHDLLVRAVAIARANVRRVILPHDLPITKGLQERIHEFRRLDEGLELQPILDQLARHPPLDLDYADDTSARFPEIIGGFSVALARSFKILQPGLKNPRTEHWQRSLDLFDLTL